MYRITFIALFFFLLTIGCVSKSEYNSLEIQLKKTQQELKELQQKYEKLSKETGHAVLVPTNLTYVPEDSALSYIKDYYNFYDRDKKYRNVQLRRISDSSFLVSIEICEKRVLKIDAERFWESEVMTLTVNSDGQYKFEME